MQIIHEFDEHGNHRIVIRSEGQPDRVGEWASPRGFANLGPYWAVSDYYGHGEHTPFPGEVFTLGQAVPFDLVTVDPSTLPPIEFYWMEPDGIDV
jgi:hypothetical protein